MPLAHDLSRCLAEILGCEVPPQPGDSAVEPVRFYAQWLAERGLGLVPVAGPTAFSWPGKWIGVIGGADDPHAVLLFGAPSGVWLDPAGGWRDQGGVVAGWLVAPLDLDLAAATAAAQVATLPGAGTVAALLVAPAAEAPLSRVAAVEVLEGRGLAGDRYAVGAGTFSAPGSGYQLTLVEAEVLDELGLPWEEARRNVVVRGIALNALVGRRFRIGPVECAGRRLAEPCAHLERLARPGLLRPLAHRGGLRADVLAGGTVSVGDRIE